MLTFEFTVRVLVVAVECVNSRNGQLAVKMSCVGFMDNRVFVNQIHKMSVKVDYVCLVAGLH